MTQVLEDTDIAPYTSGVDFHLAFTPTVRYRLPFRPVSCRSLLGFFGGAFTKKKKVVSILSENFSKLINNNAR